MLDRCVPSSIRWSFLGIVRSSSSAPVVLVTVWLRREGGKRQCHTLSFETHTNSHQAEGEPEDREGRKLSSMLRFWVLLGLWYDETHTCRNAAWSLTSP